MAEKMNRKQRRDFVKAIAKKGVSRRAAEAYVAIREAGLDTLETNRIEEGAKVRVRTAQIKARESYAKLGEPYHDFIDSCESREFTAHIAKGKASVPCRAAGMVVLGRRFGSCGRMTAEGRCALWEGLYRFGRRQLLRV